MPGDCVLPHLDEYTLARVERFAQRLGVSVSQAANLAMTTDSLFCAPVQAESPQFMRLIKKGDVMADEADHAQQYEQDALARSLAAVTRYQGESRSYCEECGTVIPEARRAAIKGCASCVDCQEIKDQKGRHSRC